MTSSRAKSGHSSLGGNVNIAAVYLIYSSFWGCIRSVWARWRSSCRRWWLAALRSTWSLWPTYRRTCRSGPKWPVSWVMKPLSGTGRLGYKKNVFVCASAGIYRELCLESVKNRYECEIQAACQHWEVRSACRSDAGRRKHGPCVYVFSSFYLPCLLSRVFSFVSEWEAAAVRHGAEWAGGEDQTAGGRPTQYRHYLRYRQELQQKPCPFINPLFKTETAQRRASKHSLGSYFRQ